MELTNKDAREASKSATATESNPSATEAVFGIVELTEALLDRLPMKDLARAQLVCEGWRKAISGSLLLQRNLFYTPRPVSRHIDFDELAYAEKDGQENHVDDSDEAQRDYDESENGDEHDESECDESALSTATRVIVEMNPLILHGNEMRKIWRNLFYLGGLSYIYELSRGVEVQFISQTACTEIEICFCARYVDVFTVYRNRAKRRRIRAREFIPGGEAFQDFFRADEFAVLGEIVGDAICIQQSDGIRIRHVLEVVFGELREREEVGEAEGKLDRLEIIIGLVDGVADMSL
ncbi:uncharacterized protein LTR77_005845 [Saxophila tyrrhenica]|uniref:F-box domain-containing protein n=1 Tax=Saxophila tyrrhenica TaxID=1690608 RepID=A0AAV9PCR5_9PEZI|nr:hypothetical protein LTR77_005845 [Saxophila tyrrhenica]